MYSAMIVDDEQWVVVNLLNSVDWPLYGFQIVGTETNSPRALEQIRELNPDLVFVDIRMPEMSGLELIKRCGESSPDTLFIVVSGFAEFSYVQKCLNLGAIGYCLKPIEEDEIVPLLKKAKELIGERSAKVRARAKAAAPPAVLDWITDDSESARDRIRQFLREANLDMIRGVRVVYGLDVEADDPLRSYRHVRLGSANGKSVFVAEENARAPLVDHLAAYAKACTGIGLSRLLFGEAELKEALEEAEMAAYQYFMSGEPTVCQISGNKGFAEFKPLSDALRRNDMSELSALYDRYEEWFKTGEYQIKHAFYLYNAVLTTIIQSQHSDSGQLDKYVLVDFVKLIERYENVGELIQDLRRMTSAYLGGMYSQGVIRSEAFLEVLQYVNGHYHENLTLQVLADEFFMNRNYIGQLFIKHVSKSFTDYLAELRVRHACELLKNSNLPIQRVGERVGYPDAYYFSKIFKKIVKKTPREYRMSE